MQDEEELTRWDIPCLVGGRPPRAVLALAAEGEAVSAALSLEGPDGEWSPGGLLELDGLGGWRCHVPDLDVPAAPALSVALRDGETVVATYEGPTWIRGTEAVLLDGAAGAPRAPATAVAAGAEGEWWVGTWGGGTWRRRGDAWTAFRLESAASGTARLSSGRLR
jgi:hypothetical protein